MSTRGWQNRDHSAYWAFVLHRVSGLALAFFLPFHFWALSSALNGASSLDAFLAWTQQPLVKVAEVGLVFLLAVHLTGGLRLLLVEFSGWQREAHPVMIAAAGGIGVFCALAFALNLVTP